MLLIREIMYCKPGKVRAMVVLCLQLNSGVSYHQAIGHPPSADGEEGVTLA